MAEPRDILLQALAQIEQIIASLCRRKGMDADAIEDFAAEVKLRLVEDDYAIIRRFEDRSPFEVYLGAVIRRLLIDYQRRNWRRFRASSEALHLGPLAVTVERLLYRDGRTIDEALSELRSEHPDLTRAALESIAEQLPARVKQREVDLENAASVAAPLCGVDPIQSETAARISAAVSSAIGHLPEEDQLILRLRFESGFTVAQIARALKIPQALLYRRLYKQFGELRSELERAGVVSSDVEELIGTDALLFDFDPKNGDSRPSEKEKESAVQARQEKTPS